MIIADQSLGEKSVTLDEAEKLKPGDKLTWKEPAPGEEEYENFLDLYHLWMENHGEEVEFIEYIEKTNLHQKDVNGFPIFRVRTKVGIVMFAGSYFNKL